MSRARHARDAPYAGEHSDARRPSKTGEPPLSPDPRAGHRCRVGRTGGRAGVSGRSRVPGRGGLLRRRVARRWPLPGNPSSVRAGGDRARAAVPAHDPVATTCGHRRRWSLAALVGASPARSTARYRLSHRRAVGPEVLRARAHCRCAVDWACVPVLAAGDALSLPPATRCDGGSP